MQLPSDAEVVALITAAQQYDEDAFDRLYVIYADAVFHFFAYRCGDHHVAEDLTSTLFLKVVEALPRFVLPNRNQALACTGWIFQIANNLLRDHFRRNKRQLVPLDERMPSPHLLDDRLERQVEFDEVRSALQTLTEEQQQVLLLRFVEEHSLEEVATIMGRAVGAVKSMQHRALKRLSRLLQHTPEDAGQA